MNKIHLKKVTRHREILEVSAIAHTTWRQHYASIISAGQIEYMLEKYQSPSAIEQAIAGGYAYFLVKRLGVSVGYAGIETNEPPGKLFLSKIYLLEGHRGKGYARDIISQLAEMARRLRLTAIWLTVNKQNPSVGVYERMGFETVRKQVTDIGGGYVMDDFVMELKV